jgi:cobalt transporter subunit CbtA
MLRPMLASGLFAGLIAGLFAAGLQLAFLVPLIGQAELYEAGTLTHFAETAADHRPDAGAGHSQGAAGGEDGVAGTVLTVMMTVLTNCGFGLLLVAAFALAERLGLTRVDPHIGLMFGLAGFAATQLMPALGLAPNLPGASVGQLDQRQLWWLFTAVATLAGIGLIAWGNMAAKLAGAVLIAAPHLVGAPQPEGFAGVVPPELSAQFAARVLVVGALVWAALGALAGHFWSHEAPAP